MSTKQCGTCEQTKSREAFHKDRRRSGGLQSQCKECQRAYRQTPAAKATRRAYNQLPAAKATKRAYRQTPVRVAHTRAYATQHRADHPEHLTATNALNHAVEAGTITRPDKCSACGCTCTPHGHHEDYGRPLDVTWLCATCHHHHHHSLKAVA